MKRALLAAAAILTSAHISRGDDGIAPITARQEGYLHGVNTRITLTEKQKDGLTGKRPSEVFRYFGHPIELVKGSNGFMRWRYGVGRDIVFNYGAVSSMSKHFIHSHELVPSTGVRELTEEP
jgi:hypothetical protein